MNITVVNLSKVSGVTQALTIILLLLTVIAASQSSGATTSSVPGGPAENGLVVGIVIGAFVMFVATVIGSVVST